jgi:hypothetical protein
MGFEFVGHVDPAQSLVAHVQRISPMHSDYQRCYIDSVHFLSGREDEEAGRIPLSFNASRNQSAS